MTVTNLIEALVEEIRCATAGLKLPVEYQRAAERQDVTVNIFAQYIPKDLFEVTTYYPCVVAELLELTDDLKSGAVATVGLSIGVFAKESDGWKDCFHLTEVIRQRLLSRRTLAKKYRLTGDITWQVAANQPTPFFFMYGELQYRIYLVQEPIKEELV